MYWTYRSWSLILNSSLLLGPNCFHPHLALCCFSAFLVHPWLFRVVVEQVKPFVPFATRFVSDKYSSVILIVSFSWFHSTSMFSTSWCAQYRRICFSNAPIYVFVLENFIMELDRWDDRATPIIHYLAFISDDKVVAVTMRSPFWAYVEDDRCSLCLNQDVTYLVECRPIWRDLHCFLECTTREQRRCQKHTMSPLLISFVESYFDYHPQ